MNAPLLDLMKDKNGYDRTFKRYRVGLPMLIRAAEDVIGTPVPGLPLEDLAGLAHNISLSGIGFVCCGRFDLQSLLEIEVTVESQTFLLLARVRWCQELNIPGEPLFHYGAQFVRTEATLAFIPVAAQFLLAQCSGGSARLKSGIIPSRTPGTSPAG